MEEVKLFNAYPCDYTLRGFWNIPEFYPMKLLRNLKYDKVPTNVKFFIEPEFY